MEIIMALIDELTEKTVERIAEVITGTSELGTKSIIFMALSQAMADAYQRGIDRGIQIAEEDHVNLQA